MSKKNKKRKVRSPRKPLFAATPENKLADLPVTPLTEALGFMQSGMLKEALELVNNHLADHASDGLALHLKGLILHRLKQYDFAVIILNRSIEFGPAEASWLMNLGVSIRATGDLDNAIVQFEKAMAMDPNYKPVNHQMALTLFDKAQRCRMQYEHQRAIELLEQAITYDDNEPQISHALAVLYDENGKVEKAIELQKQSLEKNPEHHDSRLHLAQMLRIAGQLDDAKLQINQLPDSPNKRIALAQLQYIQGDDEAAWANLQKLPHEMHGDINYLSVSAPLAPKYHQIDDTISQLHTAIKQNTSSKELALMHFQLRKLYDTKGQYDNAFDHARYANTLQNATFDVQEHGMFVEKLMQCNGYPNVENDEQRPLFIVGMPRSGISLVEQILEKHSKVYSAGELNCISTFTEQLEKQNQYPHALAIFSNR